MNNFERQETIDEMVAAHTPRELAGMVLDAWEAEPSIKAEGINEAAEALYRLNVSDGHGDEDEFAIRFFKAYANSLESKQMNWGDVSDSAINFNVSKALGLVSKDLSFKESNDYPHFASLMYPDYCNSWADMGPLISENGISLIKWCEPDEGYEASVVNYYGHGSVCANVFYSHTNPLRAAAIVFLMMNGVKPENLT